MRYVITTMLFLCAIGSNAQMGEQKITGLVLEEETSQPIVGAVIQLFQDTILIQHTVSDYNGSFLLAKIPVGRYSLTVTMIGMMPYKANQLQVSSGKSIHLTVSMNDDLVLTKEVVVKAQSRENSLNEMAGISARQFDVQETDRYAGSRGDPARMASNFAGVVGADDSRNDIVIRGNSPQSVLWRLEGIDLPNPNHFNIPGTAGGPVSIINNKYLGNSDFYTGAFPAEFGNSTAGAFDLRMRNGQYDHHEFSAQLGFLGTELFAEGPLPTRSARDTSLRKPSYLLSYRYSTVQLFSLAHIDIGTDAVPKYQDGAFRLNWPLARNNNLALWGVLGNSSIDILISDQTSPDQRNIYGQNDRDQYFDSDMAVIGLSWNKGVNNTSLIKSNTAFTQDGVTSKHNLVYRHLENGLYQVDSLQQVLGYQFRQNKWTNHTSIQTKFSSHWFWRSGVTTHWHHWKHADSLYSLTSSTWNRRWNSSSNALQLQPYTQVKWKPNAKWSIVAGVHSNMMALYAENPIVTDSKKYSQKTANSASWFEPRVSVRYEYSSRASCSIGLGRHSQMQAPYIYTYLFKNATDQEASWNRDLKPSLSDQILVGWQFMPSPHVRFLMECYYQKLRNIPIDIQSSSFSLVNSGAGFSRIFPTELVNDGEGSNMGIECTIEHFFHKGWLWLITASLFDAKYIGSDGVVRNTDFNNQFAINALVSKEWLVAKRTFVVLGSKVTSTGGRWYGPADVDASNEAKELIYVDSLRNSLQFRNYFRWDVKINLKINRTKITHEIGVDLVNILNTKNILSLTYAPDESEDAQKAVREEYQLGFLPLFYYKIDF